MTAWITLSMTSPVYCQFQKTSFHCKCLISVVPGTQSRKPLSSSPTSLLCKLFGSSNSVPCKHFRFFSHKSWELCRFWAKQKPCGLIPLVWALVRCKQTAAFLFAHPGNRVLDQPQTQPAHIFQSCSPQILPVASQPQQKAPYLPSWWQNCIP